MHIDFGEIVNTSFKVAWRYKSLWILGLFANGTMNVNIPNVDYDKRDFRGMFGDFDFAHLITEEFTVLMIVALAAVILLTALIFFVLYCICTAALIDSYNNITRGGAYRLGAAFKTGLKYFWRMAGLNILAGFVIGGAIAVMIGIIVLAFVIAVPLGIIALIPMIPIGFMVTLLLVNSFTLAERALVVRNARVFDAVSEGFNLFWANKVNNFILFLINLGLGIAVFICTMIVLLIFAIPFVALGLLSGSGWIIGLLIGLPLFLLVMLPFSGYLGAVFEGINTLFYFRLVEPQGVQPDNPDSPYQSDQPYQSA